MGPESVSLDRGLAFPLITKDEPLSLKFGRCVQSI